MIVEMGKEYRLANGNEFRLLCTDAGGNHPVVGLVIDGGEWVTTRRRADGTSAINTNFDLIEIKPRIKGEFWLAHLSREQVVALTEYPCATHTVWNVEPIAITHHTYDCEEGEGLK